MNNINLILPRNQKYILMVTSVNVFNYKQYLQQKLKKFC